MGTLRYEGKHCYMKSTMALTKNYINPCKSIATKHQYMQCLHLMTDNYLENNTEFSKSSTQIPLEKLDAEVKSEIDRIPLVTSHVSVSNSVTYHGLSYDVGAAIVTGYSNDNYNIGVIENILYINCQIYFVHSPMSIYQYSPHSHGYILQKTSKCCIISRDNLLSPFPLPLYSIENDRYILSLKHFLQHT